MRFVKLHNKLGHVSGIVSVDDEDYKTLSAHKWYLHHLGYVLRSYWVTRGGRKYRTKLPIHRDIMNPPPGMIVDHINGNQLDNRRCNLRICTQAQNVLNRRSPGNKHGLKGVRTGARGQQFHAQISVRGKKIHCGSFYSAAEAHAAYCSAAKKYHGEFARFT